MEQIKKIRMIIACWILLVFILLGCATPLTRERGSSVSGELMQGSECPSFRELEAELESLKGEKLGLEKEVKALKKKLDSNTPEYWIEYGRASLLFNNLQSAIIGFRRALDLNPQYLPAYKHLGMLLLNLKYYNDAKEIYEEAIQVFAEDSELWTSYGYCLIDLGNNKEALEAFQRSIELNTDPSSVVSARLGASALLKRQGDKAAAKREYEEAVKSHPEIVKMLKEQRDRANSDLGK